VTEVQNELGLQFGSYLRTATRTDSEVSDISDDERNLPVNICLPMFYLFQDEHTRTRTPFSTAATPKIEAISFNTLY